METPKTPAKESPDKSTTNPATKQPVSGERSDAKPAVEQAPTLSLKDAVGGDKPAAGGSGTDKPKAGKTTPPKPSQPQKKKSRWKAKLIMLLIIAALAAVGYYYLWPKYGEAWLSQALNKSGSETQSITVVESQTVAPVLPPSQAVSSLLAAESQAREAQAVAVGNQLADMQLEINSLADRVRALSTTTRTDWLLAEAEYLLRLANQRIFTERQGASALGLMESADSILRDIGDPELFPVRKALADDITRLRMVGTVDREGLYLQLDALINSIDQLPLPTPKMDIELAEPAPVELAENLTWYQQLWGNAKRALQKMTGLVRIQRRDRPIEPMLDVSEESLVRQNLRFMLEQGQLALMREEQALYEASMTKAGAWVAEYFTDSQATTAFMQQLESLKVQNISQQLPTIAPSLKALQAYINLWHNRHQVETGEEAGQ